MQQNNVAICTRTITLESFNTMLKQNVDIFM